jgi:hypothetical protein
MGLPRFLVRNLFSRRCYPLHVLAASASSGAGEVAGSEFIRVGSGNRDPFDLWTNEVDNVQVIGKVTCDRVRTADSFALDRGHNLAGKQVVLECSDDDFTLSTQVVFDVVLPIGVGAGDLDDALGVRTEEGAWLKAFPARAARHWRVRIPAMGTGLRPQVIGMWLDQAWAPGALDTPLVPDAHELGADEARMGTGWLSRSGIFTRRLGRVALRLTSTFDYELARDHVLLQFGQNRPMWVTYDDERAERTVLAVPVLGTVEVEERRRDWFYPYCAFDWVEHQPKEAA